jgi:hypothetical protein
MWMFAATLLTLAQVQYPPAQTADAAFAFSNQTGDRLLVWNGSAAPRRLVRAACTGGRTVDVAWLRHQTKGSESRGRQTAYVFDDVEGELFAPSPVLGEQENGEDDVCLLMSETFDGSRSVHAVRGAGDCDAATRGRLARAKGRAVVGCWNKGHIDRERQVVLVLFEKRGTDLLAALAVLGAAEIAWDDYPAEWDEEQISCWRVDDGCDFPPDAIEVLFGYVLEGGRFGLAVTWAGPEGQALRLLEGHGAQLRALLHTTRYWSPL